MRSNIHVVRDEIPLMQMRRKIEQQALLDHLSNDDDWAIEILAWCVVFGCLFTACLLAWAAGKGWL